MRVDLKARPHKVSTHCGYIVHSSLCAVLQSTGNFSSLIVRRYGPVHSFISFRSYRASNFPNSRLFAYFSHIKCFKPTFLCRVYSPRVIHGRMLLVISKLWKCQCRLLLSEFSSTPKVALIFACGKCIHDANWTDEGSKTPQSRSASLRCRRKPKPCWRGVSASTIGIGDSVQSWCYAAALLGTRG